MNRASVCHVLCHSLGPLIKGSSMTALKVLPMSQTCVGGGFNISHTHERHSLQTRPKVTKQSSVCRPAIYESLPPHSSLFFLRSFFTLLSFPRLSSQANSPSTMSSELLDPWEFARIPPVISSDELPEEDSEYVLRQRRDYLRFMRPMYILAFEKPR